MIGPPIIDVAERVRASKEARIQNYPCHSNRASELGHSCERYLVLSRTRWQEKALGDTTLQFIFGLGNRIEEEAKSELREAGFKVFEPPRACSWPKYQISGHLDCKVSEGGGWGPPEAQGEAWPVEIKGLNHPDWQGLNTPEDFFRSRKPWIRKYPAQLTTYMFLEGQEWGLFYIKSKLTGLPKGIWLKLDYEYAETLLQKAERVNIHVAAGTVPDPIEWEDATCQRCGFLHICLPDRSMGIPVDVVEDRLLEGKLLRRELLKSASSEYDALDKEIKARFKGVPNSLVGAWNIIGKEVDRTGFTVEPTSYWKMTIARISQEPIKIADLPAEDATYLRGLQLEFEDE